MIVNRSCPLVTSWFLAVSTVVAVTFSSLTAAQQQMLHTPEAGFMTDDVTHMLIVVILKCGFMHVAPFRELSVFFIILLLQLN